MTIRRFLSIAVLTAALPSGCTRVHFTEPLRHSYEHGGGTTVAHRDDAPPVRRLDALQFFVSERIVLEREIGSRDEGLRRGRIRVRKGRLVERVVVRRGTPGVAVHWGPDFIDVSFEEGTHLRFVLVEPSGSTGAPNRDWTYYELRSQRPVEGSDAVDFEGHAYQPLGASQSARLLVDRRAWTRTRWQRQVLRGRRVSSN